MKDTFICLHTNQIIEEIIRVAFLDLKLMFWYCCTLGDCYIFCYIQMPYKYAKEHTFVVYV